MLDDCVGPLTFNSNEVETKIVDLAIIKQTCRYALVGKDICYTITATNNSDVDMFGVLFSDEIPENTTYIIGSFEVDDVPQTPMMANNTIQYPINIPAGESVNIRFCVHVNQD